MVRKVAVLVAGGLALFGAGLAAILMLIGDSGADAAARCNCTVTTTKTVPVTTIQTQTVTTTQTVTVTVPATTTAPPPEPVWSADHETGDASQWDLGISTNWDDAGCVEHAVVADGHAQSGVYSMKMTIDDTGLTKAGCRQAQTRQSQDGNTYVYETSFFLPVPVLTQANHWNMMQWKSKCDTCGGSDPIWTIDFQGDPLRPVLGWKGGNTGLAGPFSDSGQAGQIDFTPFVVSPVPVAQWTKLTVLLDQSTDYDGAIKVWHDGTLLYDLTGVRTTYANGDSRWSVNNYSNGLTVNPYTLYIDDASISLP